MLVSLRNLMNNSWGVSPLKTFHANVLDTHAVSLPTLLEAHLLVKHSKTSTIQEWDKPYSVSSEWDWCAMTRCVDFGSETN